jgi:hypothetical protein
MQKRSEGGGRRLLPEENLCHPRNGTPTSCRRFVLDGIRLLRHGFARSLGQEHEEITSAVTLMARPVALVLTFSSATATSRIHKR